MAICLSISGDPIEEGVLQFVDVRAQYLHNMGETLLVESTPFGTVGIEATKREVGAPFRGRVFRISIIKKKKTTNAEILVDVRAVDASILRSIAASASVSSN